MRFFFEFLSCSGLPTQRAPKPAVPEAEEERSLVPETVVSVVPSRRPCRKKMRIGEAEWKPSLGSISEDVGAPPPRVRESPRKGGVASAGRDAKRRSNGKAAKVRHRSYSDSYYGSAPSTMMPTFMF